MSDYDSDSSDAEDTDRCYIETNVLLGYAAEETSEDTISQLGGRPTWLDPSNPPSAALAKCKVCNDFMVLLLQLNGDLPEFFPGHERRLYVFSCRRSTCRRKEGSVRAIRGVRVSEVAPVKEKKKEQEPVEAAKPRVQLGESLFGVKPLSNSSANPFSTSTSTSTTAASNPFSISSSTPSDRFPPLNTKNKTETNQKPALSYSELRKSFASKVTIGPPPPPEPWPTEDKLPNSYQKYYIGDADYEILDKESHRIPIPQATQVMELDENDNASSNQREDQKAYEDKGDPDFDKFSDRLAHNPEQVIRYEFRGQPLLYSKTDSVGKMFHTYNTGRVTTSNGSGHNNNRIPRCGNCGAARVFEVQLCPHAILELEAEEDLIDGMEWTVIAVAVCEKDCSSPGAGVGEAGYVEEVALVQWEPAVKYS